MIFERRRDVQDPLVAIKCLAYNHENTIRQTLEGFVKQKTDYPFIAVVHDDASTDETANIIREYAEKYPDIIKPIFEKKNVYKNSPRGTIGKIVDKVIKKCKYVALCEGDDYWISPYKLQKQVEFLEKHPEYSMCCSDAVIVTDNGEIDWSISQNDLDLTVDDLIKRGGLFIQTASIIYRKNVKDDYPECCLNCHVGDYPLQIMCGLKGKVRYFSDKMVAYRFAMGNSWTAQKQKKCGYEKKIDSWISEMNMLKGLDEYSNHNFHKSFMERELFYIMECAYNDIDNAKIIMDKMFKLYPDCIEYASKKERLKIFLVQHHFSFIWKAIKFIKCRN